MEKSSLSKLSRNSIPSIEVMMQKANDLTNLVYQVGRRLQLTAETGQFPALTQQKVFCALIDVLSLRACASNDQMLEN